MSPLQSPSAAPPLGPPLVALLALCLAGVVAGAVGSAVVRRLSNPVGKYRLLYAGVVLPAALFGYGVLAVLDFGLAVRTVLLPGVSGLPGAVLASFVTMLAGSLVGLAAYAPTIRGVRAVRGVSLSTATALARMARYAAGLSAVFALVYAPLRVGLGGVTGDGPLSTVALIGGLVGFVAAFVAASPWLLAALRTTRRSTDAEADRLATLRERAGLTVRDVRVFESDGEETASVLVRGVPGYRRLFVTDTFLDAFDDDTATALLAVQAGRVRSNALARRIGAVVAAALALSLAFSTGPFAPLVAVSAVVLLVGLWLARRGVTAGDDYAADRFGADAVAAAFERYADFHALEPSRRRVPNPLSVNVPLGDRLDRLRANGGGTSESARSTD